MSRFFPGEADLNFEWRERKEKKNYSIEQINFLPSQLHSMVALTIKRRSFLMNNKVIHYCINFIFFPINWDIRL